MFELPLEFMVELKLTNKHSSMRKMNLSSVRDVLNNLSFVLTISDFRITGDGFELISKLRGFYDKYDDARNKMSEIHSKSIDEDNILSIIT